MSNTKNKKMKYYAVKVGWECNKIVTTWDECQKLTQGFKGNKFKSFENMEKANDFLNDDIEKKSLIKTKVNKKSNSYIKKGTTLKINIDSTLLGKFSKLCDEYEVSIDKQIERLIKEWADLY